MNRQTRQTAFLLAIFLASCAKRPVAQLPPAAPPPKQNLVVLLRDETGKTGRIEVSNAGTSVELNQENFAVRLGSPTSAPSQPFLMDQAEIQRIWGAELASLPAAELSFSLYFELNSVNLVAESLAILPQIVKAIADRKSTDVSVIGHTDTTGDSAVNFTFGLNRAAAIRARLEASGIDRSILFVSSHGDKDLLVPTPPNTNEARNRRVEVIVR
ncbi:MAG: OmpA family protein [Acidobacteria bacterium]|nr:OmpA family protein [Acidobacteriota bacterium]